jgi:cell division protein FtsX
MWIKANGAALAVAVCLGLMAAGCGASAKTTAVPATVTVTTTASVQSEAFVHIYFCTTDTCAKEATQAQISAVSRRASESPLVEKVVFISKEEALAILRRKHPEEVKLLPSNPLPDRLTVFPKHSDDVEKVAALFTADPAVGIFRVDYGR